MGTPKKVKCSSTVWAKAATASSKQNSVESNLFIVE